MVDTNKDGGISEREWAQFDNLCKVANTDYVIPFRLFDVRGTGAVNSADFQTQYEKFRGKDGIPFDFKSEWATLYIGGEKHRHDMTYEQFAQMMRGLQGERIRQEFHRYDTDRDGYIDPPDFEKIIRETASHKLSDHILDNLSTLCNISPGSKISYANVRAFQNVIRETDLLDLVIRSATLKSSDRRIDKREFLDEAAKVTRFSQYTPMEAEILFHFAGLDNPSGRLTLNDFSKVFDASYRVVGDVLGQADRAVSRTMQFLHGLAESAHHFALGSIAGAFGAFMVYPIDLVKTRMQNQRTSGPGQRLYVNSIDCAQKVIKNEGFRGLYSGVLPQLVGVAPEKAIKLTVNDLVRGRFTDKETGVIPLSAEILAGGTAGACQVVSMSMLKLCQD